MHRKSCTHPNDKAALPPVACGRVSSVPLPYHAAGCPFGNHTTPAHSSEHRNRRKADVLLGVLSVTRSSRVVLFAGFARSARSRSLRSPSLRLGVLSVRLLSRGSFFGLFFWALPARGLDTPPGRYWSTLHPSTLQVIHFQRIARVYACARVAKIAPKMYDFYAKS